MTSLLPQFIIIAHKSVSCRASLWVSCLGACMFNICLPVVPGVSIMQNLHGAGWLLSIHIGLLCGIWVSQSHGRDPRGSKRKGGEDFKSHKVACSTGKSSNRPFCLHGERR